MEALLDKITGRGFVWALSIGLLLGNATGLLMVLGFVIAMSLRG